MWYLYVSVFSLLVINNNNNNNNNNNSHRSITLETPGELFVLFLCQQNPSSKLYSVVKDLSNDEGVCDT